MCNLEEHIIFHFNLWLRFQQQCRLLHGYAISDDITDKQYTIVADYLYSICIKFMLL